MKRFHRRGFTLIEMMVAVVIVGIIAAIGWPSYQSSLARSRLNGAAETLAQDMQLARSQSIKESCKVTMTFTPGAPAVWSYRLTKPSSEADCGNSCVAGSAGCTTLRTVEGLEYKDVTLTSTLGFTGSAVPNVVAFDAVRTTTDVNPNLSETAGVTLTGSDGAVLKVRLNVVGRVAVCSSTGSGGYPAC